MNDLASGRYQVVPPLSDEEFAALKSDIELRGVLVPVEYDEDGNVLDGHHRIRACQELGIGEWDKIIRRNLGDDLAKRTHARALNLARRHLTSEAKRRIIAEQLQDTPAQTNRSLGRQIGVDHHTAEKVRSELERNGEIPQYERAMDEAEVSRPGPARRAYEFVGAHDSKLVITKWSGETEWHTPAQWLDAARRVLGAIDLDPASSDRAQQTVGAATHFTKEMDGLSRPWRGRVWLNPPYAAGVVDRFVAKLVEHVQSGDVTAAVMLVDARTDTAWFHHAASACQRICLKRGRISFVRPDGVDADASTSGSAFIYFGGQPEVFEDVFAPFGLVVRRA